MKEPAPHLLQARWRIVRFCSYLAEAEVPDLTRVATVLSRWKPRSSTAM